MTCPRCEGSVLELEDVWFSYGAAKVLEGVSLEVPAGSFAALIGPNGAGKSTLLRLILGILKPQKGTVSLFGQPPGKHGTTHRLCAPGHPPSQGVSPFGGGCGPHGPLREPGPHPPTREG